MKVMVPVSALKKKNDSTKNYKKKVTFSDGICAGSLILKNYIQHLPPICSSYTGMEFQINQVENDVNLIKRLKKEQLRFFIKNNFFVNAKIVKCMYY